VFPANPSQVSVVKRADGCIAGAGWPSGNGLKLLVVVDERKRVKMLLSDSYGKGLKTKWENLLCLHPSLVAAHAVRFGMSVQLNHFIWATVTAATASAPLAVPTLQR
jgi:hypothetical protein